MSVVGHRFLKIRRTLIDVSSAESKREGILLYRPGRWWLRWIPVVMSWFAWLPWPGRGLFDCSDCSDCSDCLIDRVVWGRIEEAIGACKFVTIYLGNGSEKSKLTIKARLKKELTDCRIDGLTDCEGGELTDCRIDGLTDCMGTDCVIVKLGNTAAAGAAIRNEARVLNLLHEKSLGQSVNPFGRSSIDRLTDFRIDRLSPSHQSVNQSIRQSVNSPIRQSVNPSSRSSIDRLTDCRIDRLSPSHQSVNQSIGQSVNPPIRQSVNSPISQSVNLTLQIPRVIGEVGSFGPWTWSVQTVLPRGKSPNRLQKEHFEFLAKLKEVGISHGDFAPWNCAIVSRSSLRSSCCANQSVNQSIRQSDNVLVVWDWEDAGPWVAGKDEGWFRKQVRELLGGEVEKKV